MIKLAGVVVLYNPTIDVIENIKSYLSEVEKLYVVDNSDCSNEKLVNFDKKIEYIANMENLGIAKAFNIAANKAIDDGFSWLLTMDQDSRFEKKELKKLINYLNNHDNKKIGIICPWHIIVTLKKRPKEEVEELLEVMSSGSIMNLEAFKKVGGFKEWFFIDNVDIEYCFNLNVNGYKVLRLNSAELQHHLGDSTYKRFLWKRSVCSNHNYIRRYYITRNILYTVEMYKNYFPEYCKFLKCCLKGNLKTVTLYEKDKYRKIRSMYRGYRDFKKGVKGKYPYTD